MKKEKTSAVVIHMEDGLIEAIDGLPAGTKILVLDYTLNLDPEYESCSCKQGTREHAHQEITAP